MTAPDGVTVEATTYEVTAAHPDLPDRDMWAIRVERRSPDSWAVLHRVFCWNRRTKAWDYEPRSSGRGDAFRRTHRFPLDVALDIARREAPRVTVMGLTAAQATTRWMEQDR